TTKNVGTRRAQSTQRQTFGRILSAGSAGSAFLIFAIVAAQPAAQESKTRAHVQALASPRLEGRLAGSNGEKLASDYIVGELKKIGAKPLPGRTDLLMPFEFTAGTRDGGSSIMFSGKRTTITPDSGAATDLRAGVVSGSAPAGVGVRALSFSDNGDVEAPVVFAGYGIVVPDGQGLPYDSYATLDVKDRIAVVLRYFPEEAEAKTKQVLSRYADL